MHKLNALVSTSIIAVFVATFVGLPSESSAVAGVANVRNDVGQDAATMDHPVHATQLRSAEVSREREVVARNLRHAKIVAAARLAAKARAAAAASTTTVNVWASGFQSQLNACRGAVNLTATYGVRVIGEKWTCGGSRFPTTGKIVRLTGEFAGTYRVGRVAAVLNAYTQNSGDIPRGYQLLYQTCRANNPRTETFTVLTRMP